MIALRTALGAASVHPIRTLRLSWPARALVVRLRLRVLRLGQDVPGAVLLLHHVAWTVVLALPGSTITRSLRSHPNSFRIFAHHGGDPALLAIYVPLLILTAIAVLRLALTQQVVRFCLLAVASLSVGLAVAYVISYPSSLIAWDAVIRAAVALLAYSQLDEE